MIAIFTGILQGLGTFIAMHHVMVAQQSFYVICAVQFLACLSPMCPWSVVRQAGGQETWLPQPSLLTHKQCIHMRCSNLDKCSVAVLTAYACSVAAHCDRVLLVLCLAETDACYLAAVASQSQTSIPGSALHDQCWFDNSGIATPSAAEGETLQLAVGNKCTLFDGLRVSEIICIERIEASRQC